jgi:hypothetical protein
MLISCLRVVRGIELVTDLLDSSTWMSGNAVKIDPLSCKDDGVTRTCSGGPQNITPQNVRKICSAPRC